MPEMGTHWALLGLLLVPLIRWLHLFNNREPIRPVSALFLWRDHAPTSGPGQRRSRPDPAWRRRAWVAALLVLALAGPRWLDSRPTPLPVLFDDAPSMHTLEAGRERRQHAVELLLEAVNQSGTGALELHPLRGENSILLLEAGSRNNWQRRILEWLRGPINGPPRTAPERDYWLVSDGADQTLADRLQGHPPARIIRVGSETENLALTRLAVHPSLVEPERLAGLAEVFNAGRQRARARLQIRGPEGMLQDRALELDPGAKTQVAFMLPEGSPWLRAVVWRPGESLTLDDRLELDLGELRQPLRVQIPPECSGERLRAALTAHPRLSAAPDPLEADILVVCGVREPATATPLLWLPDASVPETLDRPVYWTREAGNLRHVRLTAGELYAAPAPPRADGTALLASERGPLILLQAGPPPILQVLLDLEASAPGLDHRFPTLLAGLLDRLLGRELLVGYSAVGRDPANSRIAPGRIEGLAGSFNPSLRASMAAELAPYLLWAAFLILLADTLLMARGGSSSARKTGA